MSAEEDFVHNVLALAASIAAHNRPSEEVIGMLVLLPGLPTEGMQDVQKAQVCVELGNLLADRLNVPKGALNGFLHDFAKRISDGDVPSPKQKGMEN